MKLVYFLRRKDGIGPIKIGCSVTPEWRCRQISSDMKASLEILTTAPGGFREEGRLHRQLASDRLNGEWFAPSEAVLAVVHSVARQKRLPPADAQDRDIVLARRYLNGETLEEIAVDFGITRERVRQILRASGVPSLGYRDEHKNKPRPISAEERKVARLYQDGATATDLVRQFPHLCIASTIIRTKAKKYTQDRIAEKARKVGEAYLRGDTANKIAEDFGFSHATYVYRYLRLAGVVPKGSRTKGSLEPHAREIIGAYRDGATISDIAAKYGGVESSLRALVKRHANLLSAEDLANRREAGERRRIAAVIEANKRRRAA